MPIHHHVSYFCTTFHLVCRIRNYWTVYTRLLIWTKLNRITVFTWHKQAGIVNPDSLVRKLSREKNSSYRYPFVTYFVSITDNPTSDDIENLLWRYQIYQYRHLVEIFLIYFSNTSTETGNLITKPTILYSFLKESLLIYAST